MEAVYSGPHKTKQDQDKARRRMRQADKTRRVPPGSEIICIWLFHHIMSLVCIDAGKAFYFD